MQHHAQVLGALTRIGLGWIFLWAFLDKMWGLGFGTAAGSGWVDGVSPTAGYLAHATQGPLAPFFQAMAGSVVVDVLFMVGCLLIGLALMLGIGVRIAGYSGALLLVLMYLSALLPEHNPLLDEHIIYALMLLSIAMTPMMGEWWGLGNWWKRQSIVQRLPWLR